MRKRLVTILLAALVAVSMMPLASFGEVTDAKTPSGIGNTSLKWSRDFQSGGMDFSKAPTVPALIKGSIYVGSANKVYKLNKNSGKIQAKSKALSGQMGYGTTPMIGDSTGVYVFVTGAKVIKLSLDLKKVIWTSKTFDGQNICPIKLIDGRIYGGTWGDSKDGGTYFCLDAGSGKTIWTQYDEEGFYWAGAVECEETVFFASDASLESKGGRSSCNIYSVAKNGKNPQIELTINDVRIRSTPAVDSEGFIYYTSMKNDKKGALTKYKYDKTKASGKKLISQGSFSMGGSSNSPLVDGDLIFVGDGNIMNGSAGGGIYAVDRSTMKLKTKALAPGPIQGEMCISKGNGKYTIYAGYNDETGGLYQVEMPFKANKVTKQGVTFIPERTQFCLSNVVCDDSKGTLFYKNDAGVIMAVKSGNDKSAVSGVRVESAGPTALKVSWDARENVKKYKVSYSTDGKKFRSAGATTGESKKIKGLECGTKYYVVVDAVLLKGSAKTSKVKKGAPVPTAPKVKAKNVKAKSVKLTWNKPKGTSGYTVYRATKKDGKYKKVATIKKAGTKTYTDKKLKKGKTYYYKVRPYVTKGGSRTQGGWSDAVKVKIKK